MDTSKYNKVVRIFAAAEPGDHIFRGKDYENGIWWQVKEILGKQKGYGTLLLLEDIETGFKIRTNAYMFYRIESPIYMYEV